jgi:hypothetical protein
VIDAQAVLSPGWWLQKAMGTLGERQARLNLLDGYYRGEPPLPEGTENLRPAYQRFQERSRTNFAALIVEAVRERMVPTGFRTGADGTPELDQRAWAMWQDNSLDADAGLVHRASLSLSDAYVMVGPAGQGDTSPVITPEDPREVITFHDPIRPRRVLAALKVYGDDVVSADMAHLYLPGRVYKAARRAPGGPVQSGEPYSFGGWGPGIDGWEWVEGAGGGDGMEFPLPVVPVVRFPNRADLKLRTLGEFEDVTDVLDRINFMLLQRLVTAAMQAFRQRAIKGDLPRTAPDGTPINYGALFNPDPGALWMLPTGAELWEGQQSDLGGMLTAVRHDVQDVAAVTRTPLFYLTPDAADGSAEGASLAREGLVFKANDRIAQATESWERVMLLAMALDQGTTEGLPPDMEVVWMPPERFSLAERYDAASKAGAAGVPWRTVMLDVLQFTPSQVDRMALERTEDAMLAPQPIQVGGSDAGPAPSADDAEAVKAKADAMGALIRAGVAPDDAARRVGLGGMTFTGSPASVRLTTQAAAGLEDQ